MTNEELKAQQRSREDIDLLISELCQRMAYGIKLQKCGEEDTIYTLYSINLESNELCFWKYQGKSLRIGDTGRIHRIGIPLYKPYLIAMDSMTEEQRKEYHGLMVSDCMGILYHTPESIEWLIKNHFDYKGLIEKGLAINATNLNIYSK